MFAQVLYGPQGVVMKAGRRSVSPRHQLVELPPPARHTEARAQKGKTSDSSRAVVSYMRT